MAGSVLSLRTPAIAPSILTSDFGQLREEIQAAEASGVELIHLDVMDGHFVPNISFGPLVVQAVREITSLPLDVHLMIDDPDKYIDEFVSAGADNLTVHVEATAHTHRIVERIKNHNIDAGVAVNPGTSLAAIEELLGEVDLVLVMSVNPGFGGQSFIPESLDKIRRLREMLRGRRLDGVRIEVDGGIKQETIREAYDAGAEIFVAGSAVYNDRASVADSVAALRACLGTL